MCACVCVCVFDITVCMSMCVVKGHWPIPVRRMIHGIRGPLAGGGGVSMSHFDFKKQYYRPVEFNCYVKK